MAAKTARAASADAINRNHAPTAEKCSTSFGPSASTPPSSPAARKSAGTAAPRNADVEKILRSNNRPCRLDHLLERVSPRCCETKREIAPATGNYSGSNFDLGL